MTNNAVWRRYTYRLPTFVCGFMTAATGFIALLGWSSGFLLLAGFVSGRIPMAPSTALLFMLYGIAIMFRIMLPPTHRAQWAGIAINTAGGVVALVLAVLSFLGIRPEAECLGFHIARVVGAFPIGHMSPLTGLCFVIASLSFLTTRSSSPGRPGYATAGWWLACLLLVSCAILSLAYLYGTPFFYNTPFIPPAATTVAAFSTLGIGLLMLAVPWSRLPYGLNGTGWRVTHVFILFLAIVAAGIITAGYLYYHHYEQHYRVEVEKELASIAELKAGELVQWRKERLGDAAIIYRNTVFFALVRRYFSDPNDSDARRQLSAWLGKIRAAYQYSLVVLLDVRSVERMSVPRREDRPVSAYLLQRASECLRSGQAMFQDFHRHKPDRPIHLSLLVPILDGRDGHRPLGVLVLRIDPDRYLYPFIERWPVPSRSAETLLVRKEGNEVLFLNELRFKKDAALTLHVPLKDSNLPAIKAVLGVQGVVEGLDYRGVPVVAALRAIPGSPWFLVAKMDAAEVYAPVRERLWTIIVMVAVLLISAGMGVGLVWRQQTTAFYKERYRAERERSWLQDVISRSLNEVYVFDPETLRFFFVNAGACRNTGYTIEELIHMTPLNIDPEFSKDTFSARVLALQKGEQDRLVFETVHLRKDGSRYPAEVYLQLMDRDEKQVFLVVANDITERRRAEVEAARLNRHIQLILETADEGILGLNVRGDHIFVNPVAARMLGYEADELIGRDSHAIWHHARPGGMPYPAEECPVHGTLRDGLPHSGEDYLWRPDGTGFPVEFASAPMLEAGEIVGAVVTFRDITERKRREQELQDRNAEMERFTYTVSHDLKSPIVTIKTFLGYLAQDLVRADKVRIEQDMMYMRIATDRIGRLLDELLDVIRVSKRANPPAEVSFKDLVQEAVYLVAGLISERGVEVQIGDVQITLRGDRPRLVEVWQNLVENAAKFMGDQEKPRIEIGAQAQDSETVFFVRDNGAGIEPKYKEKIFGLFEKLDPQGEGTGIGLALVKRIIELYDGRIWFVSEGTGFGTTFFFTMPGALKTI